MSDLRRFIGSSCPSCSKDILQAAPPVARMPPGNYLWCPACETQLTIRDLEGPAPREGLFRKFFGRPNKA